MTSIANAARPPHPHEVLRQPDRVRRLSQD
jgi:hypothetical protein